MKFLNHIESTFRLKVLSILLSFWDVNLWLAITAIVLFITSKLISPYYGKTNILIQEKTKRCSINYGTTIPNSDYLTNL